LSSSEPASPQQGGGSTSEEVAPEAASIRRNTAMALGAEVTTGILTAVLTLYLARKLDPDGYGLFTIALGIGALVLLPADLGLSASTARFLAERRGSRSGMAQVFGDSLGIKFLAAGAFGLLLFALAGPIASIYGLPDLAWPLRAMAVAVFGQSVFFLVRASFEAMGRMQNSWKMVGGESIIEVSASIALVALGGGAAGAVWGRAIGYVLGALLGIFMVARLLGPSIVRRPTISSPFVRQLARYAVALMIIDGIYSIFAQVDVLLVGAILGAGSAGIYGAPLRLSVVLGYPANAITAGVAPRLAKGDQEEPDTGALELGLRALIVLQSLALAPLLVWAEPIVNLLLGPGYGASAGVLRALMPFIFLAGPTLLLTISVNYIGEARQRMIIALAALALNIAIDLVLINQIGVVGAAIGNDVAFALYAFGHLRLCRQLIGLPIMPLLTTFLRSLVAAAAMAGVLAALGTSSVSVPLLALGLIVGTAVFGVVIVLLREPLLDEISESVPGFAGRFLRRRSP
jgi:O-antigen/teichoic acid export membrane protein